MTVHPFSLDEAIEPGGEEEDPIVQECIEDALGLFPGLLTPEQEASHRMFLAAFIKTHPAAAPLTIACGRGPTMRSRPTRAPALASRPTRRWPARLWLWPGRGRPSIVSVSQARVRRAEATICLRLDRMR